MCEAAAAAAAAPGPGLHAACAAAVTLLLQLLPSLQWVSLLLWVLLLLPARAAQLQLPAALSGAASPRFAASLLLHSNTLQQHRSPKSLELLQQGL
jgi:hypothetical protein